ncbi:MAG: hypothetical protein R2838_25355 [Caldilineaceae bacterium]
MLVINPALAAMLDVKPETTVGRFYHDVLTLDNVTGDDLAAVDDLDAFFLDENPRCEGDLNRPGGRRLILAVTYTPITNEDGACSVSSSTFTTSPVSARKRRSSRHVDYQPRTQDARCA